MRIPWNPKHWAVFIVGSIVFAGILAIDWAWKLLVDLMRE